MPRYNLYTGLSGGFGGATFHLTEEFDSIDEATDYARELAIEEYESYGGCHGLVSMDEICERVCSERSISEDELSPEDEELIENEYMEEVEGWIDYVAVLASEDYNKV